MADGGHPNPEKEDKPEERKVDEQNLIVALRIRPINEDEIDVGATPIAHRVDNNMVVLLDPTEDPDDILRANRSREKQYVFDKSFDGAASQKEVYENTTKFLIPSVINGYNATVFAYGATGAGKTYTMLGTDDEPGIMVHTLNDLFMEMDRSKTENIYKVTLSYLEIYNEMIRDLLNPSTGYLDMREDAKGVQVAGLSQSMAKSPGEVMAILKRGNLERTQEPTAANKTSSRSHAVLQITVRQRTRVRDIKTTLRIGKLFLIDLAGSERAANTHNRGKRMVEGAHINRSLLALGNCINALSDKNGSKYVNYRDSKLTRLLKDALGGNCKTVMIAHISPASVHFEESRNTLVYADRAKNIKTKVRRNVMDVSYHIAQYTNIIQELKEEIKRLRSKIAGHDSALISRNSSAIHAIQNEVLEVARKEDQLELSKLKEELLKGFGEQMECRRTLMDINHNAMEISLEATRNQNIIDKWERNCESKMYHGEEEQENKYREEVKDSEGEPEEVKHAREEIKVLEKERDNNEKMKTRLLKELDNAKNKAAKVEEILPNRINSLEQQEVLSLLCKVHELEIENMQIHSSCVLRDFELRRREVQLERYRAHRSLCDEIIHQQRQLIQEQKIDCSQDLENLLLLYHQQVKDRAASPAEGHISLPDINLYKGGLVTNMSLMNRRMLDMDPVSDADRLSAVDEETPGDPMSKLFTPASTANGHTRKHIRQRSVLNIGKIDDPSLGSGLPRQKSIITLSSRSDSSSPSSQAVPDSSKPPIPVESPVKDEDRRLILNNTRSIAMLAQQRRSKAQVEAFNMEKSSLQADHDTISLSASGPSNTLRISDNTGYKLTQSRLAQHDNRFGSQATLRHLISDDVLSSPGTDSVVTAENNFKKNRSLYRNAAPKKAQATKKKARQGDFAAYQQLAKQSPRKSYHSDAYGSNANLMERNRRARIPVAHKNNRSKALVHHADVDFDDDLKDIDGFTPPPPQTMRPTVPEKGKGQAKQKKGKVPVSGIEPSSTSTPQSKKAKKISPTIPNYGKGDISVAGFGLQK